MSARKACSIIRPVGASGRISPNGVRNRPSGDRRAVLLLRRAQNGEVDEVHRRVGLQQVAPDPFPRVRQARHQKHPQPIPHAVDDDRGAVVGHRQFARRSLDLDLEDVGPAVGDGDVDGVAEPGGQVHLAPVGAVARDGEARPPGAAARLLDAQRQRRALADDAEARRLLDDEPTVA
jgi:hypothetical protein